jgi:putative membrane protein
VPPRASATDGNLNRGAVRSNRAGGVTSRQEDAAMVYLLINWVVSAVSLMIVAHLVSGFQVASFGTALVAALVVGFFNATIGLLLKIVTFPLTIVTLGLFLFVVNAIVLMLASKLVSGFVVNGFGAAFVGAIVLALVHLLMRAVIRV